MILSDVRNSYRKATRFKDEIRGIQATVKMMNNLKPAEREIVLNAIDDYVTFRMTLSWRFRQKEQRGTF